MNKNEFLNNLLGQMTIKEKIGQLNLSVSGAAETGILKSDDIDRKIQSGQIGGIFGIYDPKEIKLKQDIAVSGSRLGIPLLFGLDVIHGHKTMFPIPLALSCSWDTGLIKQTARIAAQEATADGLNWVFSPMVDITRDPRWGRVAEGAGEDPYLGSEIAFAMVEGLQGDSLSDNNTVLACVKHMALYGAAEAGRDYNTVDMSEIRMYEEYFPPYKAAIDAGVGSVMTAFNDINGIPCSANKHLLTEILRNQWGFEGFVVTDYTAINEMIDHGLGDIDAVSKLALNAGVDMDMVGEGFVNTLEKQVNSGEIPESEIDRACLNILKAKYDLGLFEDPYHYIDEDEGKAHNKILTVPHRKKAREAVSKSCVLLKNDNALLPLKPNITVALIGPLADNQHNMLGMWNIAGDWQDSVSVLQAMERDCEPKNISVLHAKGSNIIEDDTLINLSNWNGEKVFIDPSSPQELLEEALIVADKADVIIAVVGEAQEMSGESASRTDIDLPKEQKTLIKALKQMGKPLALITMSGRPLTLVEEDKSADAILHCWFGGTEAGNGITDLILGEENPSGKLTMTFPRGVGQIPLYYNHKKTGRPLAENSKPQKFKSSYIDEKNTPLYPFGFGLSYTNFVYGDLSVNKTCLKGQEDSLIVSLIIKNTGQHYGEEIVQLYISDLVASVTRPVKSLKSYQKIGLEAQSEVQVSFKVCADDLRFYNAELDWEWEEGEFLIHLGPNSRDTKFLSINWRK